MSAGRSKATEDVLGASKVDSCKGSQLVSHIQQQKRISPSEMHSGQHQKWAICVCSVAWRTICIEETDGNWIQRARKASSLATTRRAKPTCWWTWRREDEWCEQEAWLSLKKSFQMTSWLTVSHYKPWSYQSRVHWYWATKHDENQQSTKRANWGWYCRFSGGDWGKSSRGGSSKFTFYWSSSAEFR